MRGLFWIGVYPGLTIPMHAIASLREFTSRPEAAIGQGR
jgi:hypothetical protein